MKDINIKLIYKITSVIAMIFFFIPTCTISCAWSEYNVSAAHATVGYRSNSGGWYSEPKLLLLCLIIIPVAIFAFSIRLDTDRETSLNLIAVLSGVYIIAWPLMHFLVQLHMDRADIALPYRMTPSYYLAILDGVVMFVVSMHEMHLVKNPKLSEEGDKISQYVSSVMDNFNEKERLWMCKDCFKAYAISSEHSTPDCPNCHKRLLPLNLSVRRWEQMSPDDRRQHMDYISNGGIREL